MESLKRWSGNLPHAFHWSQYLHLGLCTWYVLRFAHMVDLIPGSWDQRVRTIIVTCWLFVGCCALFSQMADIVRRWWHCNELLCVLKVKSSTDLFCRMTLEIVWMPCWHFCGQISLVMPTFSLGHGWLRREFVIVAMMPAIIGCLFPKRHQDIFIVHQQSILADGSST